jgi:hypothetical protein
MDLARALRAANQDYESPLTLSQDSREELVWWDTQIIRWNGRTILSAKPVLTVESDSSKLGWGACCRGISTGGPWTAKERARHINCLELLAATLALKSYTKHRRGISVLLKLDNTTAVAYINNHGGTVS